MDTFPVILRRDDNDTILVAFPDVPQAHTFGDTEGDALHHAVGALETAMLGLIALNRDIPRPSPARGRPTVSLPPLSAAKIALYRAMRAGKVSRAVLARRLKLTPAQLDRLLDLRHASRLDQIDKALRVLGKRLVIDVRTAA